MLFDSTLLFLGSLTNTGGISFATEVGVTSGASNSPAINLGTPRDLGIGAGQETPKWVAVVGTGFTSSQSTQTVTLNFMGSTNSTNSNFVTYSSVTYTTASLTAGSILFNTVPPRLPGTGINGLPQYYALSVVLNSVQGTSSISTGTLFAGIVLEADTYVATGTQYSANYTVA